MYEIDEAECNGICLSGADLGVPEYGGIAYAHPDCPEHGDPVEEWPEADICGGGQEDLRYVRLEDVAGGEELDWSRWNAWKESRQSNG